MTTIALAKKYRPERFEDVRGQVHVVRILSGLILRGQRPRNLLLHGAYGSGKTSLVRLYAKAMNCLSPTRAGSPCGTCASCASWPSDGRVSDFFEYDVGRRGGDKDKIIPYATELNRRPSDRRFRIIFFDEAHGLTPQSADGLLKMVEEPADGVIFCFATTEFERVAPTLRSRLFQLEVRRLADRDAISFLQDVARNEGLDCEPEALALIAGLKKGHPRDLLNGLEQVYDPYQRPLTAKQVQEIFDVDHTGVLVELFLALGEGDVRRQTEIIFDWREPAVDQIRWIQALLLAIYYNELLGTDAVVDPLVHSIQAPRNEILERFCHRLDVRHREDLEPYWRQMINFWQSGASDDATAHLLIAQFQIFINEGLGASPLTPGQTYAHQHGLGTLPAGEATLERDFVRPGRTIDEDYEIFGPKDAEFFEEDHAREVVHRASFLVQEYGVTFNASFAVRPSLFGVREEADGRDLILQFCSELQLQGLPSYKDASSLFACLVVLERDSEGLVGRIAAHLPEQTLLSIDAWVTDWASADRVSDTAIVASYTACREAKDLQFHWNAALNLCAGLDAGRNDTASEVARDVPLLELLKIPKNRWRSSARVTDGLCIASSRLGYSAIMQASDNGLKPLSALDDRAWEWIRKGWEVKEYRDRQRTKRERETRLETISQQYCSDPSRAATEIEKVKSTWGFDPRNRQRRWTGWWKDAIR